jgi:CBS domain-containing protein
MLLSSKFVIQTERDVIRIPLSEIEDHILPSCRTCTDFTAELADISVGGAYPLKDWSTVIIRTKVGEDFFYDAVENGVINTWVIEQEPNVIERVMVAAMQKRTNALKEAKEIEEVYGFLPVLLLRESDVLAQVKVEEIMTKNIKTIPCDITVSQFLDLIAKYHHVAYPMINEKGEPAGIVTLEEASKVEKAKRQVTLVSHIARRKLVVAYPEETALCAFKRMEEHEVGRILILDPANPKKLLGMVTKTDLMHALTNNIENT